MVAKKAPAKKPTPPKPVAKKPASKPIVKPKPRSQFSQQRVLLYSGEGVGKTDAYLSLLKETSGLGYILDCDGSVEYTISHMGLDPESIGARIYNASDPHGSLIDPNGIVTQHDTQWLAMEAAGLMIRKARPKAADWIIIERIDKMWDAVHSHWMFMAYGETDTGYWSDFRAEMVASDDRTGRSFGGFSGNRDWPYIRKTYNSVVLGLLMAPLCSKLATTLSKEPFPQAANVDDMKALYGDMMPAGESRQGSEFWLIAEIKIKVSGDRSLFVRRIKRQDFTIDNPYLITDDEGNSNFGVWMKEIWGWTG